MSKDFKEGYQLRAKKKKRSQLVITDTVDWLATTPTSLPAATAAAHTLKVHLGIVYDEDLEAHHAWLDSLIKNTKSLSKLSVRIDSQYFNIDEDDDDN